MMARNNRRKKKNKQLSNNNGYGRIHAVCNIVEMMIEH